MPQQTYNSNKNRAAACKVLVVETVITTIIALLLYISVNSISAYSALLGGATFIVPNLLFAGVVFWQSGAETAKGVVSQIYIGEAIKIFATIVLFAGCFILVRPVNALSLLGTYAVMMVINLVGLSLLSTDNLINNDKE